MGKVTKRLVVCLQEVLQLEFRGVLSSDDGGDIERGILVQGTLVFEGTLQLRTAFIIDVETYGGESLGDLVDSCPDHSSGSHITSKEKSEEKLVNPQSLLYGFRPSEHVYIAQCSRGMNMSAT